MDWSKYLQYNENNIKAGEALTTTGTAIQATGNGGVTNVIGKMGQLAGMGAAVGGPIGMGVGAAVGLATGLIDNKKIKEEQDEIKRKELEAKSQMDYMRSIQMASSANPVGSVYGNNLFAFGGNLPIGVNSGNSNQISSDGAVMKGANHEQGGINIGNNNEVEGEETIIGNKVFSKRLEKSPGYSFADAAEHIAKSKGKLEMDLATETDIYKKEALNRLILNYDNRIEKLFNEQELVKEQLMLQGQNLQQFNPETEPLQNPQEEVQQFALGGELTEFEKLLQSNYDRGIVNAIVDADPKPITKPITKPIPYRPINTNLLGENEITSDFLRREAANYTPVSTKNNITPIKTDFIPTKKDESIDSTTKTDSLNINIDDQDNKNKILEALKNSTQSDSFNENLARLGTSVDNIVNSILTDKTPQIPVPLLQDPVFMKAYVDVGGQVGAIKNSTKSANKSIDENVNNSAIARANKMALYLQQGKSLSDIYGNKENVETGLMNQNVSMLNQVQANNLSALNNYNINKANREAGMLQDKAANVANAQDDLMWNVQRTDMNNYQKSQLLLTAMKDTTGVFERNILDLPQLKNILDNDKDLTTTLHKSLIENYKKSGGSADLEKIKELEKKYSYLEKYEE